MARQARFRILSEINHIMLRGNGHMDLFFKDDDFQRFLDTVKRFCGEDDITVLAYCLMTNHVHLILKATPKNVPMFFRRIGVSYSAYFNGIYGHTGHLFQNRYKSESILDEAYFLAALRYVLRNPEAAGICRWEDYRWSSAKNYLTGENDEITNTAFAFSVIGGKENFSQFMLEDSNNTELCISEPSERHRRVTDIDAIQIIRDISGMEFPTDLQNREKAVRDELLVRLKQAGISVRQLERLTGINRNVIQRAR